ncbi:T9SS type B sorting domain-containing protein [Tamlana fucoidanivorans]|nr:T9SS type B sorting domain-containing protein [Tamlana fucoidanivorans]
MAKKANLLFFFVFLISISCFTQITYVPDDNFEQALIDLGYDTPPLNDLVPTANIANVVSLELSEKSIQDLTGIEDFKILTNLNCSKNQLDILDLSNNLNLVEVYCSGNNLTSLNVSRSTELQRLWCFGNNLSDLNVMNNTELISLRCENNNLNELDTSTLTNLNILSCENNQITDLDLSSSTSLARLLCGGNFISNLNISSNYMLTYLSCENNQIASLDVSNSKNIKAILCQNNLIDRLNLSKNSNLLNLNCSNNDLCKLDLRNGNNGNLSLINFSNNPSLTCVLIDNAIGNHSTWQPENYTNYVTSEKECGVTVPVDYLNNFIGSNYTLPYITYGNYFTASGGKGSLLYAGQNITTSQTIYIYNEINCFDNESRFNVIITDDDFIIPKFFTPNNDGTNDTWQVFDVNHTVKNILIFNRYGKLLKTIYLNSEGWDGTFNGYPQITDTYWYHITLNTGEVLKGPFTLKR